MENPERRRSSSRTRACPGRQEAGERCERDPESMRQPVRARFRAAHAGGTTPSDTINGVVLVGLLLIAQGCAPRPPIMAMERATVPYLPGAGNAFIATLVPDDSTGADDHGIHGEAKLEIEKDGVLEYGFVLHDPSRESTIDAVLVNEKERTPMATL